MRNSLVPRSLFSDTPARVFRDFDEVWRDFDTLCRIIFAMLRDTSDFDVGKLAVERGPFERKVVRLYRRKPAVPGRR